MWGRKQKIAKSSKSSQSSQSSRHIKSKSSQSYKDLGFNNDIDITEGDPVNDHRVIALQREIKQLKERVEAQAELTRKLENDKNDLESKLESWKKRCSDLQRNLDDKDEHLNEVVANLTSSYAQHSKPMTAKQKNKKSSWSFGWGSPRSGGTPRGNDNIFSTPQHTPKRNNGLESSTHSSFSPDDQIPGGVNMNISGSPLNDNIASDDYVGSLPQFNMNSTMPLTMTAPTGSLSNTTRPRRGRSGSVNIISATDEGIWNGYTGDGTNTLIGLEPNEMEFRIKNSSSNKLRNFVRDLFTKYQIVEHEKNQLFQDLAKATHGQGWAEKEAIEKKKE
eukprot:546144_1